MNISYINMCKLKKNRERRNELERERGGGGGGERGWRLVVMVCVVVHLVYHLNKRRFRPLYIFKHVLYLLGTNYNYLLH
jgi:hypothetical protein